VNRSTLALDQSLIDMSGSVLRGERAAVVARAVHLVVARALLRSLFVACPTTTSPYQVLGEDWYGRG
jgi:hypothetical protein